MFDNRISRLPYGVVNVVENGIFSDLPFPTRITKCHEFSDDFDRYAAGEWTVTGAGTAALTAGDGGLLAITSPVSTFQSLQDNPASFVMAKNFSAWGGYVGTLDSLLGNVLIGLLNVTTTPFTGGSQTDGIYFTSAVTTGALSINIAVGGTITTVALGTALVAGSPFNLAWYYDGANFQGGYPNGRVVAEASGAGVTTPIRTEIAIAAASTFPGSTALSVTMAVNASTAVARVLTMDYIYFAKSRINPNVTPSF
jgi:hypothetical protein